MLYKHYNDGGVYPITLCLVRFARFAAVNLVGGIVAYSLLAPMFDQFIAFDTFLSYLLIVSLPILVVMTLGNTVFGIRHVVMDLNREYKSDVLMRDEYDDRPVFDNIDPEHAYKCFGHWPGGFAN